jgi:hypothetical protein
MSGKLWHDHACTPAQSKAHDNDRNHGHLSQADRLVQMLRNARARGLALQLPTIMQAGIAQHGARFNELRHRGFVIQNELVHDRSGFVRSCYWLKFDPEKDGGHAG